LNDDILTDTLRTLVKAKVLKLVIDIDRAILDILKHSKTMNIDDLAERVIDR
ncbi:8058_t:CDS:2, partial [Racocetra fulgida]